MRLCLWTLILLCLYSQTNVLALAPSQAKRLPSLKNHLEMRRLQGHKITREALVETLLQQIYMTREKPENSAGVAITMLHKMGYPLSKRDFSKVNISGADLSEAILEGTNFDSANLSRVNFEKAWLKNASFTRANCQHTIFGLKAHKPATGERPLKRIRREHSPISTEPHPRTLFPSEPQWEFNDRYCAGFFPDYENSGLFPQKHQLIVWRLEDGLKVWQEEFSLEFGNALLEIRFSENPALSLKFSFKTEIRPLIAGLPNPHPLKAQFDAYKQSILLYTQDTDILHFAFRLKPELNVQNLRINQVQNLDRRMLRLLIGHEALTPTEKLSRQRHRRSA